MLVEIGKYIDDPRAVEVEYRKNSPNKQMPPEHVAPPLNMPNQGYGATEALPPRATVTDILASRGVGQAVGH